MSFFSRVKSAYDGFRYANGGFIRLFDAPITDSGVDVTPKSALNSVMILRCATIKAGCGASLPIDVFKKSASGKRENVSDHPIERIFNRAPNSRMSSMDFRAWGWMSFDLWGNFYALAVWMRNKAGERVRLAALWPLHPGYMKIGKNEATGEPIYIYTPPGKDPQVYLPEEIFHVRWFSLDGVNGMSKIAQAANAVGLAQVTEKHAAKFFQGGASNRVVLKYPNALSPEMIKVMRDNWQETYSGWENAHKAVILEGGMDLSVLSVNPRDSQFLEQRQYNDEQMCALMGVPPSMAGLTSKVTSWGTGIAEQKQGFLDVTMTPECVFWEKAIEAQLLLPSEQSMYVKHNVNAFLRANLKDRMEAYRIATGIAVMNPNECRELEDMDPYEGGDVYTIQSQYIPIQQSGQNLTPGGTQS